MYTYAFLQGSAPLQLPDGIAGTLQVITTSGLSAIVESGVDFDAYQNQDERLIQAVLAHDRVIRDLFRQTTLLPLRFGTCFMSEAALLNHLQANQESYQAKLNHLDGKAEYLIKLFPVEQPEPELAPDLTGRAYFLAKKQRIQAQFEQQQQQHDELEQLKQAIAEYESDIVHTEPQDGIERLFLLASHQNELQLLEHIQFLQAQSTFWRLELGEALPPYHFV